MHIKCTTLLLGLFTFLTGLFLFSQCRQSQSMVGAVRFNPAEAPYKTLSEYGFYTGPMQEMFPNEGVLPYELITPLFTDYAHKARFVWMPDSVEASVDEQGVVQFPENTVLIKNFYYPADFRQPERDRNIMETRLLMKKGDDWEAYTYVWNEAQTEAKLNLVGDIQAVSWTDEEGQRHEIEYVVPNKNQCKSCHNENNAIQPIGPKVRNLNRTLAYAGGSANQLEKWQSAGLLAAGDYAAQFQPVANWEDPGSGSLEDRALAYLDVNCGHCHRPGGPAHTSGLYLTVDYREQRGKLGVCKTPVAAGKGSGNRRFGITPGQPDSSILLFRMESEDPGIMMPELGRVMEHREGIELIREWIAGLEGDCGQR